MFGKLKDKLKSALSVFSNEAEEVAEEKQIEVEEVVEKKEEKKEEVKKEEFKEKKEKPQEKKKEKSKKSESKQSSETASSSATPTEHKKEKTTSVLIDDDSKKPVTDDAKETVKEETISTKETIPEEKETKKVETIEEKGFFAKIKSVFTSDDGEKEEEVKEDKPKEKKKEAKSKKEVKEEKAEKKKESKKEKLKETSVLIDEEKDKSKELETPEPEVAETQEEPSEPIPEKELEPKEETEEKQGFFSKIKKSLTTKTISADKFEDLFWNLEIVLLENNVSVEVIEKIKEDLKEELVDKPLPRDVLGKIQETLHQTMKEILTIESVDLLEQIKSKDGPFVITFFGINGVGKTTSIAKLTHYVQQNDLSVVFAACDTFRAAAIDQLQEHADKLNVKMIKHDYGSDSAAVAFDAIKYAEKNNINVVMIDTAGRLHSNTNLMQELEKIIRVTNPDMKLFVGESITGNDCIEQARKFNELVQMDGAILTKVDVDEKGGAPLSISYTIKKPILFLGVGQEYKDLEIFDPDVILGRLGF